MFSPTVSQSGNTGNQNHMYHMSKLFWLFGWPTTGKSLLGRALVPLGTFKGAHLAQL
jgi:hypothetical protein